MERLVKKIIELSGTSEDEDIIFYGLSALIDGVIISISILFLGSLIGKLWQSILYIIGSFYGTSTMGGDHFKSRKCCGMSTFFLWALCIIAETQFQESITDKSIVLLSLLCLLCVAIVAPVEHPNKTLDIHIRKQNKLKSVILNLCIIIWISIFICTDRGKACVLWMIQMELAISMLMGKVVTLK